MGNKIDNNQRLYSIDILRIVAGISVVAIHVSDPLVSLATLFGGLSWWVANIVNSFSRISVPLFIVLSGSLLIHRYNAYGLMGFIKKRLFRILVPLIFWVGFYWWWNGVWFHTSFDWGRAMTDLLAVKISHLYFLAIMAGLYVITPVLGIFANYATLNYQKYLLITSFLFSFIVTLLNRLIPSGAYVANIWTMFITYFCFYYAGDFLRTKKIDTLVIPKLGFIFVVLGIANAGLNYLTAQYQYFFEPASPLIIAMTILLFVIFINLNFGRILQKTKMNKAVEQFSTTIFGIYLIHLGVINIVDKYTRLGIDNLVSPLWAYMLLKIFLVFGLSYILVSIGKKIPVVKIVFG